MLRTVRGDHGRPAQVRAAQVRAAQVFTADGIRILPSSPRALRANAVCERMIGTLRRELLERLLIVNEHHLRRVLPDYLRYNTARPHRTLGQLPPAQAHARPPKIDLAEHRVRRRQVLGGLINEYQQITATSCIRAQQVVR
jgi:transposase InsO family protein